MKVKYIFLSLFIIVLSGSSCGNKKTQTAAGTNENTEVRLSDDAEEEELFDQAADKEPFDEADDEDSFAFQTLKADKTRRKPPFRETTNFDNYRETCVALSQEEIKKMDLQTIIPEGDNFMHNYVLDLPYNFSAVAVTYGISEMEMITTLITYGKNNEFIDRLDIAYDEVAESWFRKESTISESEIVVEDMSFTDENPQTLTTRYKFNADGTFIQIPD